MPGSAFNWSTVAVLISTRPGVVFFPVSLAEATVLVAAFFASVDDLDCAASGTARSAQARQATHQRAKRKLFMSSVYTHALRRSWDRIAVRPPPRRSIEDTIWPGARSVTAAAV